MESESFTSALHEDNVLELTWRRIGADVRPPNDDGKEAMLLSAWDAIDAWIDERRVEAEEPLQN